MGSHNAPRLNLELGDPRPEPGVAAGDRPLGCTVCKLRRITEGYGQVTMR
ncbi:hypothetical protein BH24ACT7_BH24ACT7_11780 [soil metagenome]